MRIGIDNVDIDRVNTSKEFLERFFVASEVDYINTFSDKASHVAGRLAVKEAVLKAIGTGLREGMSLKGIEVEVDKNGRPFVKLSGAVKEAFSKLVEKNIDISITHSKTVATAICLLF